MISTEKTAKLIMYRGGHPGREYVLKGNSITIGSSPGCSIVLRGRYVADLHAVLECRSDEVWILKSQSVNGTFVNEERIATRSLAAGDVIRFGPDISLVFQREGRTTGTKKRRGRREKAGRNSALARRPALLIGIGVYLLGLIGFSFFVGGLDQGEEVGRLSTQLVHRVLDDTREFLATNQYLASGTPMDSSGITTIDASAEPAAKYYRFIAYKRRVITGATPHDASQESTMIDEILDGVKRHLFRAWNLESQARWAEATEAYGKVLEVLPNLRAPVVRLAVDQQRKLKGRMKP